MLTFNTILADAGLDPKGTMVMRHRPSEAALRRKLPWIVAERPDLFLTYQAIQWKSAEKALGKAHHLAAFIGEQPGQAIFAGVYAVRGNRPLAAGEYVAVCQELTELGMQGQGADGREGLIFDLAQEPAYEEWLGKLIVKWPPPERAWWRWADRNTLPIHSIAEESLFEEGMPAWERLTLNWGDLAVIPRSWRERLRQWRGVYFIYDTTRRCGYVGSAGGDDNLLGRWTNYADTGHGGNKLLRASDPAALRFSILQRVSPDLAPDQLVGIENAWKERLHTREFGLNDN
jgi:hypothetical protein